MSNAQISRVQNFCLSKDQNFLFDANTLLKIYSPLGISDTRLEEVYSKLLKEIKNTGANIFTCIEVLSEFTNKYIDFEYSEGFKDKYKTKKAFRKSADFNRVYDIVSLSLKKILEDSILILKDYRNIDEQAFINDIDLFRIGMNDFVISQICIIHNCFLVTHDSDFHNINNLKIVTA